MKALDLIEAPPAIADLPAVVLLVGPDRFLRKAAGAIVRATPTGIAAPAPVYLRGADLDADVASAIRPGDLFSGVRVLTLEDDPKTRLVGSAAFQDWLLPRVAALPAQFRMVIGTDTLPKTARLAKWVAKVGGLRVDCSSPDPKAVARWTRTRLGAAGAKANAAAAGTLAVRCGHNLAAIDVAAEQVAVFAGGAPVTPEVVRQALGPEFGATIWEFLDACFEGDVGTALRALDSLFRLGDNPYRILAAMVSHLKPIWRVAGAVESGVPLDRALSEGKVPPFRRGKLRATLQRVGTRECRVVLEEICRADRKAVPLPAARMLELAAMRIAGLVAGNLTAADLEETR